MPTGLIHSQKMSLNKWMNDMNDLFWKCYVLLKFGFSHWGTTYKSAYMRNKEFWIHQKFLIDIWDLQNWIIGIFDIGLCGCMDGCIKVRWWINAVERKREKEERSKFLF